MKFFEGMEKQVSVGVFLANSFVTGMLAANKGWGKRADAWVEDVQDDLSDSRERVRDLVADVEASFDDFLGTAAERVMSYLDSKYVPSADEQASAEQASAVDVDDVEPEDFAVNVDDFVNAINEEAFNTEPVVADDVISRAKVRELIESKNFSELADAVIPVIARVEVARNEGDAVEVTRLTNALKAAGILVDFKGDRVIWHII